MAFKAYLDQLHTVVNEKVDPSGYRDAERSSSVAMAISTHGDQHHPDFHPQAIAAHTSAMKHIANALHQARQSNDISSEKQLKGLYVRHQNARSVHQHTYENPPMPVEAKSA